MTLDELELLKVQIFSYRNFALLRILGGIYQGCCTLTFALAKLSCFHSPGSNTGLCELTTLQ